MVYYYLCPQSGTFISQRQVGVASSVAPPFLAQSERLGLDLGLEGCLKVVRSVCPVRHQHLNVS